MTPGLLLRSADHDTRPWDRLLARMQAPSLDCQLAARRRARTSRLLVIRATEITSPGGRRDLTECQDHFLHEARRPPIPRTPRAPLCRDRIAAAERDVRDMLTVLPGPLPIRSAAMASSLLSDGTGPLHNRHSPHDLGAAMREATRFMMSPSPVSHLPETDRQGAGGYR